MHVYTYAGMFLHVEYPPRVFERGVYFELADSRLRALVRHGFRLGKSVSNCNSTTSQIEDTQSPSPKRDCKAKLLHKVKLL